MTDSGETKIGGKQEAAPRNTRLSSLPYVSSLLFARLCDCMQTMYARRCFTYGKDRACAKPKSKLELP